ncbi:hypothetical protein HXX76_012654 [Chlamydomonas incerta]|uniref:Uncharacterized protein n=1 Tax=Chlamydomonas incerta TaxID=51695 RepID=A0A835SRW4_CHLIN|nr:hypothetical protein HXX76_012654 [Chlamydomonas incerta]|eukprot:KAG2427144.1 hypothetical protein HXX76_012654 [Chlamydomonas incerta]
MDVTRFVAQLADHLPSLTTLEVCCPDLAEATASTAALRTGGLTSLITSRFPAMRRLTLPLTAHGYAIGLTPLINGARLRKLTLYADSMVLGEAGLHQLARLSQLETLELVSRRSVCLSHASLASQLLSTHRPPAARVIRFSAGFLTLQTEVVYARGLAGAAGAGLPADAGAGAAPPAGPRLLRAPATAAGPSVGVATIAAAVAAAGWGIQRVHVGQLSEARDMLVSLEALSGVILAAAAALAQPTIPQLRIDVLNVRQSCDTESLRPEGALGQLVARCGQVQLGTLRTCVRFDGSAGVRGGGALSTALAAVRLLGPPRVLECRNGEVCLRGHTAGRTGQQQQQQQQQPVAGSAAAGAPTSATAAAAASGRVGPPLLLRPLAAEPGAAGEAAAGITPPGMATLGGQPQAQGPTAGATDLPGRLGSPHQEPQPQPQPQPQLATATPEQVLSAAAARLWAEAAGPQAGWPRARQTASAAAATSPSSKRLFSHGDSSDGSDSDDDQPDARYNCRSASASASDGSASELVLLRSSNLPPAPAASSAWAEWLATALSRCFGEEQLQQVGGSSDSRLLRTSALHCVVPCAHVLLLECRTSAAASALVALVEERARQQQQQQHAAAAAAGMHSAGTASGSEVLTAAAAAAAVPAAVVLPRWAAGPWPVWDCGFTCAWEPREMEYTELVGARRVCMVLEDMWAAHWSRQEAGGSSCGGEAGSSSGGGRGSGGGPGEGRGRWTDSTGGGEDNKEGTAEAEAAVGAVQRLLELDWGASKMCHVTGMAEPPRVHPLPQYWEEEQQ